MNDPWSVLGVARDASEDEVKKAYHRLAKQHHPDLNGGTAEAVAKFRAVKDAYDAIRNPPPETGPDPFMHFRSGPFTGFGGINLDEMFAAFTAQHRQRNRDFHVECRISLEDAANGREMTLNLQTPAGTRTVQVPIPPGIDTGMQVRVPQAGDQSFPSFTPGDLYLTVNVVPHARFRRRGPNLIVSVEIGAIDLMLGHTLHVETLGGQTVDVKVPAGFDPRGALRVNGHGMPMMNRPERGDLLIELAVRFPALSAPQLELLRQVAAMRAAA